MQVEDDHDMILYFSYRTIILYWWEVSMAALEIFLIVVIVKTIVSSV